MAYIPYPDVPMLPGVPAIPRSPTVPTQEIGTTQPTALPTNATGTQWGFVDSNGAQLIFPDSFIDFKFREERKIPNYPVEDGSFSSYNKVALPFDIRVTVACSGNGVMKKSEFLDAIQATMDSLTLLSVITPDNTYENCNLIHVDYLRQSQRGVSLLVAQLWFQQIRITQASTLTTTEPSGSPVQSNGQVSTVPPTTKQQTQANSKIIDFGLDSSKGWD